MQMAVKKSIRFFFMNLICNIKKSTKYKVNFIVETLFMMINNSTFLVFWAIIISKSGGSVGDVTLNDIMYLWSISTISYGVAYFFFEGVCDINKLIVNGVLDTYLILPKHPLLLIATSKCRFSACGDIIYGIILLVIATKCNMLKALLGIVFGTMGAIVYVGMEIILRSLSVFLGDTEDISKRYIYNLVLNFSTYPEQIYSKALKFLLYTVIPSAYISFIPIKLTQEFNTWLFLIFVFALSIISILALVTFNYAIKHYESGNTMMLKE